MPGLDLIKRTIRGSALYHHIQILDIRVRPAQPYTPNGDVRIWYYRPDGTVHPDVDGVLMSHIAGTVGEFEFNYQSDAADPLGVWDVKVESTHQTYTTVGPKEHRFEVLLA
jgi:hypothetical protein